MKRPAVLLFALFLVVVQTAALTHDHADNAGPAGTAAQVCELCTAFQASAPAPEAAAATRHVVIALEPAAAPARQALPVRFASAHRSRAPPAFRST